MTASRGRLVNVVLGELGSLCYSLGAEFARDSNTGPTMARLTRAVVAGEELMVDLREILNGMMAQRTARVKTLEEYETRRKIAAAKRDTKYKAKAAAKSVRRCRPLRRTLQRRPEVVPLPIRRRVA